MCCKNFANQGARWTILIIRNKNTRNQRFWHHTATGHLKRRIYYVCNAKDHWWASQGGLINLKLPLKSPIFLKMLFRLVEVLFYFSCFPSCLIPIWIPGESWREILNEPEVASDIDWKHPQPELTKQIQIFLERVHFYKAKNCTISNIPQEMYSVETTHNPS